MDIRHYHGLGDAMRTLHKDLATCKYYCSTVSRFGRLNEHFTKKLRDFEFFRSAVSRFGRLKVHFAYFGILRNYRSTVSRPGRLQLYFTK